MFSIDFFVRLFSKGNTFRWNVSDIRSIEAFVLKLTSVSNLNDLVSEPVFNAAVRYIDLSEPEASLYIKLNWFLAYMESSFNIPVLSDFIRDEEGIPYTRFTIMSAASNMVVSWVRNFNGCKTLCNGVLYVQIYTPARPDGVEINIHKNGDIIHD
jgi:hypothetical protein|nr:MAG TPA: hypothetical protein [Caudoviricetes sp.]